MINFPNHNSTLSGEPGILQQTYTTLQNKLQKAVDDFANGAINRKQFHSLYDRYHRQLNTLSALSVYPEVPDEGIESTFALKRRLTAHVLGLSVYNNKSGLPIETLGHFDIDPALLIPLLSSYRSAAQEAFRAGLRSTTLDNDQWVCFVTGSATTLVALFSDEPSTQQMQTAEQMHRDFERANAAALTADSIDPSTLAYPFLSFLQRAFRPENTDRS